MLKTMLGKQQKFQERLGADFSNMSVQDRVAFIKEHSIHLNQEINEMLYELPYFKPWKDYSNMTEEEKSIAMAKARIECIDAFHFFMNLMLGLGFTADEFFAMYMMKNSENHRRQDAGYTHDVSYKEQDLTDNALCTVMYDDEVVSSQEFATFICISGDEYTAYTNIDSTALGHGIKILAEMFVEEASKLSDEEKRTIKASLTPSVVKLLEELAYE